MDSMPVAVLSLFVAMPISSAANPEDDRTAAVEALIDQLTEIDSPDYGLSPTFGGSDFPPIAGQGHFGAGLLITDHGVKRNEALTKLVALGAQALPNIAAHASDKRPTKLTITHGGGFGAMWHAKEVPYNEANKAEVAALKAAGLLAGTERDREDSIGEHTVTVGDVCFVIAGMISNRAYNALRYQPTACQVINSPTSSPEIATFLANRWSEKSYHPNQLYEHLAADFKSGESGAATRLLFYFHERSLPGMRVRLAALVTAFDKDPEDGVYDLRQFLQATAWHEDAELRAQINGLLRRTHSLEIALACLPAVRDGDADAKLFDHLGGLIESHTEADATYPDGSIVSLIVSIVRLFPENAAGLIVRHLGDDARSRRLNLARAFYSIPGDRISPEILHAIAPLLAERRPGLGQYVTDGDGVHEELSKEHYSEYRICDNFYEVISRALGDTEARCTGGPAEMDEKIAALATRLRKPSGSWPFDPEEVVERQQQQRKIAGAKQASDEALGKPGTLLKYVFPEDEADEWLDEERLARIADKYPDKLSEVYLRVLREKPHMQSHPVIDHMVKTRPAKEVAQVLVEGARHDVFEHRRAALFGLLEVMPDSVPELLIATLEAVPVTPNGPYWTESPSAFALLAIRANEAAVWEALLKTSRRVDTGSRLEILNVMTYINVKESPVEPRLEFISEFLNDESVADEKSRPEMFEGPHANFTTPGRSVRALAYERLGYLLEVPEAKIESKKRSEADERALRRAVDTKLGRK